jgi:hypothetical protein
MSTIFDLKEQAVTDTPLLVFDCALADGSAEHWSTHAVTVAGTAYEARVLQHTVFEMQAASNQGVDGIPRISLVLGNADSHLSEIERATGWKGARLTVSFLFYDLRNGQPASDAQTIFQGICNPPDEIREATFRLTAGNRMNLQRLLLPQVRIQRRCPWEFPATETERTEAIDGGANGKYSRFYRCGYSAGADGGSGSLDGAAPFAACDFTRASCQARGMFSNFGGIEYVPPAIAVRSYGDKSYHTSAVAVNDARYNDFVPLVYGTAWYTPPIVFARNDGNLTRTEVLLGIGEMAGVITVLVNDVEIPAGVNGQNMTGTGWYNIPTLGTRQGVVDPNFTDGDPYGSMAYLSVVVPNRLNDGTSLPTVKVLAQGLKLPVYNADGTPAGEQFSNNPAWVLLDILRRMGWSAGEIDLPSFATAAAYCAEPLPALDLNGNTVELPRFECNLALKTRKSAGDLARGVRNAARLLLSYGANGAVQVRVANAIAVEMPEKPAWSNAIAPVDGGWPSYEFGDGSDGISGILRRPNGEPSVRLYSRGIADTPNRFSVEFQDELNDYQQDSYSLTDPDDVARSGQEVAAAMPAMGIANYDQAGRILKGALDQSIRGNTYIEFDSSVRAFGVRPGDLIAVTYQKEGFNRQLFRVLKLAPGANHRTTTLTAQIHDDSWYDDSNGALDGAPGGRRQGTAGAGVPRPLLGSELDADGDVRFGIQESDTTASDGTVEASVSVAFVPPAVAGAAGPGIPLLSLATTPGTGGTLAAGQTLYYGVSGVDADGNEGGLSFLARATVIADGGTVTLAGLSFAAGTATFNVYRGTTPAELFRIATAVSPAATFTDTGLAKQLAAPPDPNFDHANFYWRMELVPEVAATAFSLNTVANGTLNMPENRYRGAVARIIRGKGAGQERAVASNTATALTLASLWTVEPDDTSFFAVAESGWKFGATAKSSPVQFGIPNYSGETIEILGVSANANDVESAAELSIVSRWQIGGGGLEGGDTDVPAPPFFGLGTGARGGTVWLSAVSFPDLTNTRTIGSGTVTLHYRDELAAPAPVLAGAVAADDTSIAIGAAASWAAGTLVQIDREIFEVQAAQSGGTQFTVARGLHNSTAAAHAAGTPVYALAGRTEIVPFAPGFFGSPYSGSWRYPIDLADARVASAELFVTNARGNSPVSATHLTNNDDSGLRTFAGGQYSIQVSGFLAVDAAAAPPLIVDSPHSVRDVYAVLGKAADAPVALGLNVNGAPWCTVTFVTGQTISNSTDGGPLAPLAAGAQVTLAVTAVGQTQPGADLTVIIRL